MSTSAREIGNSSHVEVGPEDLDDLDDLAFLLDDEPPHGYPAPRPPPSPASMSEASAATNLEDHFEGERSSPALKLRPSTGLPSPVWDELTSMIHRKAFNFTTDEVVALDELALPAPADEFLDSDGHPPLLDVLPPPPPPLWADDMDAEVETAPPDNGMMAVQPAPRLPPPPSPPQPPPSPPAAAAITVTQTVASTVQSPRKRKTTPAPPPPPPSSMDTAVSPPATTQSPAAKPSPISTFTATKVLPLPRSPPRSRNVESTLSQIGHSPIPPPASALSRAPYAPPAPPTPLASQPDITAAPVHQSATIGKISTSAPKSVQTNAGNGKSPSVPKSKAVRDVSTRRTPQRSERAGARPKSTPSAATTTTAKHAGLAPVTARAAVQAKPATKMISRSQRVRLERSMKESDTGLRDAGGKRSIKHSPHPKTPKTGKPTRVAADGSSLPSTGIKPRSTTLSRKQKSRKGSTRKPLPKTPTDCPQSSSRVLPQTRLAPSESPLVSSSSPSPTLSSVRGNPSNSSSGKDGGDESSPLPMLSPSPDAVAVAERHQDSATTAAYIARPVYASATAGPATTTTSCPSPSVVDPTAGPEQSTPEISVPTAHSAGVALGKDSAEPPSTSETEIDLTPEKTSCDSNRCSSPPQRRQSISPVAAAIAAALAFEFSSSDEDDDEQDGVEAVSAALADRNGATPEPAADDTLVARFSVTETDEADLPGAGGSAEIATARSSVSSDADANSAPNNGAKGARLSVASIASIASSINVDDWASEVTLRSAEQALGTIRSAGSDGDPLGLPATPPRLHGSAILSSSSEPSVCQLKLAADLTDGVSSNAAERSEGRSTMSAGSDDTVLETDHNDDGGAPDDLPDLLGVAAPTTTAIDVSTPPAAQTMNTSTDELDELDDLAFLLDGHETPIGETAEESCAATDTGRASADDLDDLAFLLDDGSAVDDNQTYDAGYRQPSTLEELDNLNIHNQALQRRNSGPVPAISIGTHDIDVHRSASNQLCDADNHEMHMDIRKASSMPNVIALREARAADPESFAHEDAERRASWFLPRWRQAGSPDSSKEALTTLDCPSKRGNPVEIASSYNFAGAANGNSPKPKQKQAYKHRAKYGGAMMQYDGHNGNAERLYDTATGSVGGFIDLEQPEPKPRLSGGTSSYTSFDDLTLTKVVSHDLVEGEYANLKGLLSPRQHSKQARTRYGQTASPKRAAKHAIFRLRGHDLTVTELHSASIPQSIAKIHGHHVTRLDVSGGTLSDFGVLVKFKALRSLVADRNTITSLDTFPVMRNLDRLSLAHNMISDWFLTGEQAHDRFPKLSQLTLTGNPCRPPADEVEEVHEYHVTLAELLPTVVLLDGSPITNLALEASSKEELIDTPEQANGAPPPVATQTSRVLSPNNANLKIYDNVPGEDEENRTPGDWGTFIWMFGGRKPKAVSKSEPSSGPNSRPSSRPFSRPQSNQAGLLPQDSPELNSVAASAAGKLAKGIITRQEYEQIVRILQLSNADEM